MESNLGMTELKDLITQLGDRSKVGEGGDAGSLNTVKASAVVLSSAQICALIALTSTWWAGSCNHTHVQPAGR
jgi:hypothetical protein